MDVLDSHLESISFDLINTLRSWIGNIIAAALGIFNLRLTCSSWSSSSSRTLEIDIHDTSLKLIPLDLTVEAPTLLPSSKVVGDIKYGCGITKGRFTVYYNEEDNEEYNNELSLTVNHETWANGSFDKMNYDTVDRVVKMRMGDGMGWYRMQDLTVVSGNVVKLWDGCCRTRSSSTSTTLISE